MNPLFAFFDQHRLLLVILLLGALVVGINFALVGLLRGGGSREAGSWTSALGGGRQAARRQQADIDALHEAVAQLPPASGQAKEPSE